MSDPSNPAAGPTSRAAVLQRLGELLGEILERPGLTLSDTDTAADVPGWDSLNHITFVIAVEREFGLRFRAAEVARLQNVGEMVDLILQRASAG